MKIALKLPKYNLLKNIDNFFKVLTRLNSYMWNLKACTLLTILKDFIETIVKFISFPLEFALPVEFTFFTKNMLFQKWRFVFFVWKKLYINLVLKNKKKLFNALNK